MQGNIYDFTNQCWTTLDTETDENLYALHYRTPDGVEYELNPSDLTQYRNA